jgi:hypothetical protein
MSETEVYNRHTASDGRTIPYRVNGSPFRCDTFSWYPTAKPQRRYNPSAWIVNLMA